MVDACHSGDATRGDDSECVRGVDVEFKIPRSINNDPTEPFKEDWLTISACKPFQLCFEMKSPVVGKLTHALSKIGSRLFTLTNEQLQSELQSIMDGYPSRLPQNPMVTGKR